VAVRKVSEVGERCAKKNICLGYVSPFQTIPEEAWLRKACEYLHAETCSGWHNRDLLVEAMSAPSDIASDQVLWVWRVPAAGNSSKSYLCRDKLAPSKLERRCGPWSMGIEIRYCFDTTTLGKWRLNPLNWPLLVSVPWSVSHTISVLDTKMEQL
jgi:hypothetical protein